MTVVDEDAANSSSQLYIPMMPAWMVALTDQTIEVGDTLIYEFGEPLNRYD